MELKRLKNQMKNKKECKKCFCCKTNNIENKGNIKHCLNCSIYLKQLRSKISYYKTRTRVQTRKLYGQRKGNQRVRLKK